MAVRLTKIDIDKNSLWDELNIPKRGAVYQGKCPLLITDCRHALLKHPAEESMKEELRGEDANSTSTSSLQRCTRKQQLRLEMRKLRI